MKAMPLSQGILYIIEIKIMYAVYTRGNAPYLIDLGDVVTNQ